MARARWPVCPIDRFQNRRRGGRTEPPVLCSRRHLRSRGHRLLVTVGRAIPYRRLIAGPPGRVICGRRGHGGGCLLGGEDRSGERGDVVAAVMAAAVDEEGGGAGDAAEVGGVDVAAVDACVCAVGEAELGDGDSLPWRRTTTSPAAYRFRRRRQVSRRSRSC